MDSNLWIMLTQMYPSRLLNIIKSLKGKRADTPPNQPISFSSKSLTRNVEIATAFDKQFTSAVPYTSDPDARIVRWKLHKECPLDNSVSRFSPDTVLQAIKNSRILLLLVQMTSPFIYQIKLGSPRTSIHTALTFSTSQSITAVFPPSGNMKL